MDVILCHTTADFDALGAAVGLTRLKAGAKIVLPGGAHPVVRDFLALHRDEFALMERRSINPEQIRSVTIVDTQQRDRLGKAAEWLDLPHLTEIVLYDHHLNQDTDIPATQTYIESVGATTTLVVEHLQKLAGEPGAEGKLSELFLTPAEATVMALGIHVDTGSLTFEHTTPRDAAALAWLMTQGVSLKAIAEYVDPGLSRQLQELLKVSLNNLQSTTRWGYTISWCLLNTEGFVPGLSSLTTQLLELTESDAVFLAARYPLREEERGRGGEGEWGSGRVGEEEESAIANPKSEIPNPKSDDRLTVIGRSRIEGTNLNQLFQQIGGGGHSQAASASLRGVDPLPILAQLVEQIENQIPHPPTAQELMSSPVRTIRPDTTIEQAQRILLRYGHSGLSVVDNQDRLVGIISRRDIDIALHHGFSHARVKGYMTTNLKTIAPDTSLPEIESLMVTYDIGRLPVLETGQLVGIVTRTDVLRLIHQEKAKVKSQKSEENLPLASCLLPSIRDRLAPPLWQLLEKASQQAEKRGWHLYLVGGAVRDLLLARSANILMIEDIDLVVDGFHKSADVGAGVELAKALQQLYPNARLDVHGQFQTAALLWHNDPELGSLWVDIATARTEFYPYPAANPEVEASSIRQDLYRRDFTINALAVRLNEPRAGELLDFFGGVLDLQSRQIRVLHANSFIEDPTRIYRAVRFAVRLGFEIEAQTARYIRYALASGIYEQVQGKNGRAPALETRLKSELKYILQAPYWKPALQLLADLGALRCIHPTLELDEKLWWQVRLLDRCLRRFDPQKSLEHWQMRLEVLIAYLIPEYRGKVVTNLQLPVDSIERLQNLALAQSEVMETLSKCDRKSEIVRSLRRYDLPTLILIAVQSPRDVRRKIWLYLTDWRNVKAPLNGNDLKALGYKPGPQYSKMLDDLLAATLDGEGVGVVCDRASAEAFLAEHFPKPAK
ncbi:CBS domain-containing protein [Argonema antarcticum]|uniref:CBS domain-containing protein n=1 Tax=Argonema antarcticum TaxID=2942763 RepID=UPI00201221EE|nr:CBS domain-containing protein [Argonema antarcticum]MCL1473555.1 CBS domain-containing protein [Argonema antarcticum A004/B2]